MSEWQEVLKHRSEDGFCRERWTLVVDRRPDGNPAAWASAMRVVWNWDGESVTFWEMRLYIPLPKSQRCPADDDLMTRCGMSQVKVGGADRRAECVGKNVEELRELFRSWGAE